MTNEHDGLQNAQVVNTSQDVAASRDASAASHASASAPLSDRDIALTAARVANEKKAFDIVVQHVEELTGEAAYFVTMTARNDRQVKAWCNAILAGSCWITAAWWFTCFIRRVNIIGWKNCGNRLPWLILPLKWALRGSSTRRALRSFLLAARVMRKTSNGVCGACSARVALT